MYLLRASMLDQRLTQPPGAVSAEILQLMPKFNRTVSFGWGQGVAQLVEALCCKSEGSGFDFSWT